MRAPKSGGLRAAALVAATLAVSATTVSAVPIYGLTTQNNLFEFDSATPGTIDSSQSITGLQPNEFIQGIDFRPANGLLYALGSTNRLYTLNQNINSPSFGAATPVGTGSFAPPVLNGSAFGFDFNPVIDRIRVVSDTDRNYVLNPNDGTATQVTNLFYGPGDPNAGTNPNVVGSAYTNNFAGTTSTQLYGIDSRLDILVTQANSAGTLGTVGPLGVATTNLVGFDIASGSGNRLRRPAAGAELHPLHHQLGHRCRHARGHHRQRRSGERHHRRHPRTRLPRPDRPRRSRPDPPPTDDLTERHPV